jgi:RNA polymerase sigma-70 factor, ECF subfamily
MRSRGSSALQRAPTPPSADECSDDELMGRTAGGDQSAYAVLVRRHQQTVRAYCGRWCGSGVLGDDLAQECFVEVWQRRASYVAQDKFRSYLFRIAANRCKNQQRSRRREQALYDAHAPPHDEPASQRVLARERQEHVQGGVDKLPEAQREAVLLRYSAELDYAEIASLLEIPEATARSRVFLGLMKLRRLLRVEKP